MKKILAALMLALLLCGCQKEKQPALPEAPPSKPEETAQPADETPAELPVVEIPAKIVSGETPDGQNYTLDRMEQREGAVEDAVGYLLEYPVLSGFDGAETVNQYYIDLADGLENYTKETVYNETMERFTVTDVYGKCQSIDVDEGMLVVEYSLSVQFHDTDEVLEKNRTDYFDMTTGEKVRSEED